MALVNFGKDYGKLVVIVDVVDQNRVSLDFLLDPLAICRESIDFSLVKKFHLKFVDLIKLLLSLFELYH